jgi:hypothetical protein
MSDIIETLLLRNLQEVFGEGDPAHRRAARRCWRVSWITSTGAGAL